MWRNPLITTYRFIPIDMQWADAQVSSSIDSVRLSSSKSLFRFGGSLQRESKSPASTPRPSIGNWATVSNPASSISVRISAGWWKNASVKYKISFVGFLCCPVPISTSTIEESRVAQQIVTQSVDE
jgi:hypothetical protein